jgi:hypothetical protein
MFANGFHSTGSRAVSPGPGPIGPHLLARTATPPTYRPALAAPFPGGRDGWHGRAVPHPRSPPGSDAGKFITRRFGLEEFRPAYDTFSRAGETGILRVVLSR